MELTLLYFLRRKADLKVDCIVAMKSNSTQVKKHSTGQCSLSSFSNCSVLHIKKEMRRNRNRKKLPRLLAKEFQSSQIFHVQQPPFSEEKFKSVKADKARHRIGSEAFFPGGDIPSD